jgi:predicted  nucleic acid-binding Zn-ribbon protein
MDKDDQDMMDSLYDEITSLKEDKEKLEAEVTRLTELVQSHQIMDG